MRISSWLWGAVVLGCLGMSFPGWAAEPGKPSAAQAAPGKGAAAKPQTSSGPAARPLGAARLAELETAVADLCAEEGVLSADALLGRYKAFLQRFEGDDPSTERDNGVLAEARARVEVLAGQVARGEGKTPDLSGSPLCGTAGQTEKSGSSGGSTAESLERARYLVKRADEHIAGKRPLDAEIALKDAALLVPGDALTLFQIGEAWLRLYIVSRPGTVSGKYVRVDESSRPVYLSTALGLYEKVTTLDPGFALAHYEAGRVRATQGDRAAAISSFDKALAAGLEEKYASVARDYIKQTRRVLE